MRAILTGIFFLGLLLVTAGGVFAGDTDAGLAEVENGCLQGCSPDGKDMDYCKAYCACFTGEIRGKITTPGKASNAVLQSAVATCAGSVGLSQMLKTCEAGCKDDAACKQRCPCLKEKFNAMGDEAAIGKFLTDLGNNDKAAQTKMDGINGACELGKR